MKSKVLALILLCGAASLGAKVKLPALVGYKIYNFIIN